jgi:oxygen-independent coproporphyrinogen-3 oxidase
MSLSVYVHIPYCLQRCRYCDFATFEWREILPPDQYVNQVLQEIDNRRHIWPHDRIATLYFGGGTPSLIAPELIVAICDRLAKAGLKLLEDAEVTIEINPATLTQEKLDVYRRAGINRFSVGAQSFNDSLLEMCGRKHSAADTRETLRMLKGLNYSFDLLFALPGQTTQDLQRDLDEVASFAPPHLSAYCLTVPEGHPMSTGRPPEDEQVDMFALIETSLQSTGLHKYEISNFARPGFESRHNMAYWNDTSYWGIGLSSHSYDPNLGPFGTRFWNPKGLKEYAEQSTLSGQVITKILPAHQWEQLEEHEALTDFCHMHLRTSGGLPLAKLQDKFPQEAARTNVQRQIQRLASRNLLETTNLGWRLTPSGQLISNVVFEHLTFAKGDLKPLVAAMHN